MSEVKRVENTNCCSFLLLFVSNVDSIDMKRRDGSNRVINGWQWNGNGNDNGNECTWWNDEWMSWVKCFSVCFVWKWYYPDMNGSVNPLTTKLYRVRKTVFKMLTKRGYSVDDNDMNMTLDTFLREVVEMDSCYE